ncbi:MAG: Putative oxidoreductase, partial [uncultured Rubrobacteraceae bacterium]
GTVQGPARVVESPEHLLRGHHDAGRLAPAHPDLGRHRRRARHHQQRAGLREGQEHRARPARDRRHLRPRQPFALLRGARQGGGRHRGWGSRAHRDAVPEVLRWALSLVRGPRPGARDHRYRAREGQQHGV